MHISLLTSKNFKEHQKEETESEGSLKYYNKISAHIAQPSA